MISAILFDADGVVQQARPDWRTRLGSCVAPEAAETFVDEVLDAELSVLSGGDFTPALQRVLDRWQVDRPVQEVLRIWELIMVDQKMITAIQQLRDGGILCYLATNQQEFRRRVMRTRLPYDQAFDDQFYSCELGVAKPKHEYFATILSRIDLPPHRVLFLDDNAINVMAAQRFGLHAQLFPANAGVSALPPLLSGYQAAVPRRSMAASV